MPVSDTLAISRRALPWLAILVAALWFFLPALHPVHVEGFSASVVALGVHLSRHSIADFMPFAPFNADYYGLTKLGTVLGISALSPLFGGDGALRLIMIVGLVFLLAASAFLIRRWSGARWTIVAATILIMPVIAESSFFFNDNVPAAAFCLVALAVLSHWRSWTAMVAAGVLIGISVATRTDMVLVAVVAVPLLVTEGQDLKRAAIGTVVAGIAALVTLFGIFALVHSSPLDAIQAGKLAVQLWDRPPSALTHLNQFVYACGLPALALLLLGAASLWRKREWRRLALLVGVPLLFNLALLGKMWEVRQFLILAPFLGALAARGLEELLADLTAGRPIMPIALGLLSLFVIAGPVSGLGLSDGPRVLSGRIWGISLWRDWQGAVDRDFGRIDRLIASAPSGGPLVVLTDTWNEDRYLHLQLLQHGFHRIPQPASCNMLGVTMQQGGRTVVQLTLEPSFISYWPKLMPEQLEQGALPCIAALHPQQIMFLAKQDRVAPLLGRQVPDSSTPAALRAVTMSAIITVSLSAADLNTLDAGYRRIADPMRGDAQALLRKSQLAVSAPSVFSR
ncbi:MAG: hypothetical protein ABIS51_03895 [Sphingomonas sp.]